MKIQPWTVRERLVYVTVVVLIQPVAMYVCLKVLHWSFFLSFLSGAALGIGIGLFAVTALRARSVR